MESEFTSALSRFDELKASPDFLNFLLNNINSTVLLLDSKMQLQAFNEPIKTLFTNSQTKDIMYIRCGEALGCAHTVEEEKDCGSTTKCLTCELREYALMAYATHEPVYAQTMERMFYKADGSKENKMLEFSIKPVRQNNHYYLLTIINDITYSRLKPSLSAKN